MPEFTTWEGMPVPVPEGIEPRVFAEKLLRITGNFPFTAFRWKRDGLHAGEAVGCIQLGNVRINILPKLDTPDLDRDKSFLINVLRSAGVLNHSFNGAADVRVENVDPLEALISEVVGEISYSLHSSYPKRYESVRESLSTIRGQIDFTRLSNQIPGLTDIPVTYSTLRVDNKLSRAVKGIVLFLHGITRSLVNKRRLAEIISELHLVKNKRVTLSDIESIALSKYEDRWSRVLTIGRLFLKGQSPDPTFFGGEQAFALLFPLQNLYEQALKKIIGGTVYDSGLELSAKNSSVFLLVDPEKGSDVVRLKPDYIFRLGDEIRLIGDAKWKRVSENGAVHGIKRDDLYQIYVYLARYNVSKAIVFIPRSPWMALNWTKLYHSPVDDLWIHLVSIDLESLLSRNSQVRNKSRRVLSETISDIALK